MAVTHWTQTLGVNSTTTGVQTDATVAVLDGGGFVVVWTDNSGSLPRIRAQLYDTTGQKSGAEFLVNAAANLGTGGTTQPSVTAINGGGFVVSWTRNLSASDHDIHAQVYSAAGVPVGSVQTVINDSGLQDFGEITRLGSGFAIIAQDDRVQGNDTLIRRFDAAGTVIGSDIIANTTAGGNYQAITELSNGNFVVAWNNGGAAHYRLYNSAGTAITAELNANVTASGGEIALTAYGNGGFIVSWMGSGSFPTSYPSIGRLFDASGAAFGPLMYYSMGNNNSFNDTPELTVLGDGRIFATWFDGSGHYYGRVVDPFSGAGGSIIAINTNAAANFSSTDNNHLSIDTLADGRIVAVWSGANDAGGDQGIFMQILDPREGTVTGSITADLLYGSAAADDMNGLGGADILHGMGGDDVMFGGSGADTLYGEEGIDTLFGGNEADTLIGGGGNDKVYGEDAADVLYGETGDDMLAGGWANDVLYGQAGNDVLYGEGDNDTLFGGEGADNLYGQAGNDTLNGEGGNDFLWGGLGTDTMSGGAGFDTFYFEAQNQGTDTIIDFGTGDGFIFAGSGFAMPAGFQLTAGVGFLYGAGVTPVAATATVYFDTNTHALWFDQDGTGGSGANVIAFLLNNPALQAGFFTIV